MKSQMPTAQPIPAATVNIDDRDQLISYLRSHQLIALSETPEIRLLEGGVSSRTCLVESSKGAPFVLKQALEKLRVDADWFSSPNRIHIEAEGMRALRDIAPQGAITTLLFEDFGEHIIAMSAVPSPNCTWKHMLLTRPPAPRHFEIFADILSQIHVRSLRNSPLQQTFYDRTEFERLRIEPYYRYSAERIPQARSFFQALIEDTYGQAQALVHGDYSPKNILVHADQFVLVDHEVIHYGDPAFDVGFALTHLLGKALHRADYRQELLAGASCFVERYLRSAKGAGFDPEIEARICRHALACLLARVKGRSPFEYLSEESRDRQLNAALQLISAPPKSTADLISSYEELLN